MGQGAGRGRSCAVFAGVCRVSELRKYVCVYMYLYMFICRYICIFAYFFMCLNIYTYMYMTVAGEGHALCAQVRAGCKNFVNMYVCIYIYI